jgi:hypothetical protein
MCTHLIYSCITAFLVILSNAVYAQQIISSTGSIGQNSSGTISYTLGELVIGSQNNGNSTVTQGFHQTEIIVTVVRELSDPCLTILAYPNPTNDFITLKFENSEIQNIEYILFDLQGKLLLKEKLKNQEVKVSFETFNPGSYFIKVLMNRKEIRTFKILKK